MAKQRVRSDAPKRVYITNIGTPKERVRKEYATSAGAKQWCRAKLGEHKAWADAFNHALAVEVSEVSKTVDELNITSLPPNQRCIWRMTDDYSGFTFVVELWVEER